MKQQKTEQLNELFDEWEASPFRLSTAEGAFIRDGIICEDLWNKSKRKIAFLLKEVNKFERPDYGFDFRRYCYEEPWRRLGQWAYGLQQAETAPEFRVQTDEVWIKAYRSSAVINLKKTAGGPNTNWKKLRQYSERPLQQEQLRKEIQIVQPSIVVCGGRSLTDSVFKIASDIMLCGTVVSMPPRIEKGIFVQLHHEKSEARVWIEYIHPSIPGKSHESIYGILVSAFKEFTNKTGEEV